MMTAALSAPDACIAKKDAFGRWILICVDAEDLAWAGQSWAPADALGFPAGESQICNFPTFNEASMYAFRNRLRLVGMKE